MSPSPHRNVRVFLFWKSTKAQFTRLARWSANTKKTELAKARSIRPPKGALSSTPPGSRAHRTHVSTLSSECPSAEALALCCEQWRDRLSTGSCALGVHQLASRFCCMTVPGTSHQEVASVVPVARYSACEIAWLCGSVRSR